MKYHTVLFDLDGTLTDSYEGISKSVQHALRQFGIIENDPENLRRFCGPSLYDGFTDYYQMNQADTARAVEAYRERYRETGMYENSLYPGAEDLLHALKQADIQVCIASSKPEIFIHRILSHFGIDGYFDAVSGAKLDGGHSDKAEVIETALALCGLADPTGVLMVGDRLYDAKGAQHHAVDFCGALYGFGTREELSAFPHVLLAETTGEIRDFVLYG